MLVLEFYASNVHHVLVRLLDQTRVAGLALVAVTASAEGNGHRIRTTLNVSDQDVADKVVHRVSTIIGIGALHVQHQCSQPARALCPGTESEDATNAP